MTNDLRALLAAVLMASVAACSGDRATGPSGPAAPAPPVATPALGDLHVTVVTNGEDLDPDGYMLTLDRTAEARAIGTQGAATFASVTAGAHSIQLDGLAYNCAVDGEDTRTATVTADATFDVSFEVGCTYIEGRLDFEIDPDVPLTDARLIQAGLDLGQAYLDSKLGGGIPRRVRDTIPARIVATGRGNEEPDRDGGCCTALATSAGGTSIVRLFFDVAHPEWTDRSTATPWSRQADRRARAAREYARAWQHALGCLYPEPSAVGWLSEGIARWIGYQALIADGAMASAEVLDYVRRSAEAAGQLARPVAALASAGSHSGPGHVAYLAIDQLVQGSSDGALSLRRVCEAAAAGDDPETAFEKAFGISLAAFYGEFEAELSQAPESGGKDGTPPGVRIGGLSGLDSSNAPFVHFTLSGSVVDRNGDGTAVTSAVVRVTVDPGGTGDCPGPLESPEETGVTPSDSSDSDPVSVDVTRQVNANGGRWLVEFRAENLLVLSGLGEVTYCFEVAADDGAKRKDGTDDGVRARAFVAKDFTWF